MISWFFLFVFPSSFLMAFIMVGGNGWRNRTVQLSIAHTSKQASNTSNSAARSKPMFQTLGYICKLDIYLLSRERGGITFSHPSNGTGHIFLLLGASHFNHNSTTNDITKHHDPTIPKIPLCLDIIRCKHTDTNDSHESMMNGMARYE